MANYTRVRFVCRNMQRMERFFVLMVVLRKHNEKRASIIYGVVYPEKEKRRVGLFGNKCIFAQTDRFLYAKIGCRTVNRPDWGGFFMPFRILPFLGDFRGLRGPGGTSYRPGRKSVLNRRNAKNNFFCTKV